MYSLGKNKINISNIYQDAYYGDNGDKEELNRMELDIKTLKELQTEFVQLQEINNEDIVFEQHLALINLEKEINILKEVSETIHELIVQDAEKVDEIEKNVETTTVQMVDTVKELETASYYATLFRSRSVRTVGGAVIGGVLFGGVGSIFFGLGGVLLGSLAGTGSGAVVGAISPHVL